jgi:hypothetical protein
VADFSISLPKPAIVLHALNVKDKHTRVRIVAMNFMGSSFVVNIERYF